MIPEFLSPRLCFHIFGLEVISVLLSEESPRCATIWGIFLWESYKVLTQNLRKNYSFEKSTKNKHKKCLKNAFSATLCIRKGEGKPLTNQKGKDYEKDYDERDQKDVERFTGQILCGL